MPEGLVKFWEDIKKYWNELGKEQKTRIYVTSAIIVVALAVLIMMLTRVEYVPLLEQTDDIDLQAVVEYLDTNEINYKKINGEIYIDKNKKSDLEFDLTSKGIVSPDVKFTDTWNSIAITSTESDKQNLWKNFKTVNLVYKLKKFKNVISADVEYTEPEKTLWQTPDSQKKEGSAFVKIESKIPLTPDQVDGVVRVAAASLGIPQENITVVDENFHTLNMDSKNSSVNVANTQEQMRQEMATYLQNSIYALYSTNSSNYDSIRVTVNPKLNFDTFRKIEEGYTSPDGFDGEGVILNNEELKENATNAESGSAPGVDSNPGTVSSYQMGDEGSSEYTKSHKVNEYGYNQFKIESEKAVGELVPENSSLTITIWYGTKILDATGLNDIFINQVKTDASRATGIPVSNISVSVYKSAPEVIPEVELTDRIRTAVDEYGFFGLMFILIIALAVAAIPRRKKEEEEESELEPALAEGQFAMPDRKKDMNIPDLQLEEHSEIKKQIEKIIKQDPDAVAQLLRNWLQDDYE